MQYVFVLLRGDDFYIGGHLWRSDSYGAIDTWEDLTPKLTGKQSYLVLHLTAVILPAMMCRTLFPLNGCAVLCNWSSPARTAALLTFQPVCADAMSKNAYCHSKRKCPLVYAADAAKNLPSGIPTTPDMLGVLDLHFHQRHPQRILIQGPGFFFWVTEDYGRTFTAHPTPGDASLGFWMELKIHPNVPEWLLAKVKRKDCLEDLSASACAHDLMVSKVSKAIWAPTYHVLQ